MKTKLKDSHAIDHVQNHDSSNNTKSNRISKISSEDEKNANHRLSSSNNTTNFSRHIPKSAFHDPDISEMHYGLRQNITLSRLTKTFPWPHLSELFNDLIKERRRVLHHHISMRGGVYA